MKSAEELRALREGYEETQNKYKETLEFFAESGARLDGNDIQKLYNIVESNMQQPVNE